MRRKGESQALKAQQKKYMSQSKKMLNLKVQGTNYPGNLRQHEKTKPKNNRNKGRRRNRPRPKVQKIFSKKIIEENFPNLNKEMPIKVQEAYRITNSLEQKRKSPQQQ